MTKLSLHVGVNRLDPGAYAGFEGWLRGCENDATGMAALAVEQGYTTLGLLTERATRANFRALINQGAEKLLPGDWFFLSYAGHGTQFDSPGSEYGLREALCFFDGPLRETTFRGLLALFRPGVNIRVVLDCCYAAGFERATPFGPRRPRSLPAEVAGRITPPEAHPPTQSAASIALLCAADVPEVSYDGPVFGVWTGALLEAWARALKPTSIQTWFELARVIVDESKSLQTPQLRWLGSPAEPDAPAL